MPFCKLTNIGQVIFHAALYVACGRPHLVRRPESGEPCVCARQRARVDLRLLRLGRGAMNAASQTGPKADRSARFAR